MNRLNNDVTGEMYIAACITENGEDTATDVKLTTQEFEQMFGFKPQGNEIYHLTLTIEDSDWPTDTPTYGEWATVCTDGQKD